MVKSVKKIVIIFLFLAGISAAANFALAATVDLGLSYGNSIGLTATDPRTMIARVIQIFLGFLGIIAISLVIYGGFLWMTAAGNEEQIERAKKTLTSALIGLLIILSAFGITTFLLNKISAAVGTNNTESSTNTHSGTISGSGAVGDCSVENVYPTPGQSGVARNTSLVITFKEDVDPTAICQSATNGLCNGSNIKTSNVLIYKTGDDSSDSANLVKNVRVYNSNKKTFFLRPDDYLGSGTDDVSYTVHFTNDISASGGGKIFDSCQPAYLEWQFEVSSKIDLTPPQVVSGGVFPPPDNSSDTLTSKLPVQAAGSIEVKGIPLVYAEATSTKITKIISSEPDAVAEVNPSSAQGGNLTITVSTDGVTATLHNNTTNLSLGAAKFSDKMVDFSGILSLTAASDVAAGNSWTVVATAAQQADTLTVGSIVYTFVNFSDPEINQIKVVSGDTPTTAKNIAAAISDLSSLASASASGKLVSVAARQAGAAGNSIVLKTTSQKLTITAISGGSDGGNDTTVNDQADQPRNSVIQISFNEPIYPNNAAGDADSVSKVIRVVNNKGTGVDGATCSSDEACLSYSCVSSKCSGNYLAGTFTVSNLYRTVEFKSNIVCGTNGCGEKIYCLPENSNLKVLVNAATLASCSSNTDCQSRSPYTTCNTNCKDASVSPAQNYPLADISSADGIMDIAANSLDGNRDGYTQGPLTFFSQNNSSNQTLGDNFSWAFFISNKLDTTAPVISATIPSLGSPNSLSLTSPVRVTFNKIMMASSLVTGSTAKDNITHKNINLWSLSGDSVGYWIESSSTLSNKGTPINTVATINHSAYQESYNYRAQIGSGVNDIYQNCFKPSAGQACSSNTVNDETPSCCNGSATAILNSDGNCP
jgi:hypothetical protein